MFIEYLKNEDFVTFAKNAYREYYGVDIEISDIERSVFIARLKGYEKFSDGVYKEVNTEFVFSDFGADCCNFSKFNWFLNKKWIGYLSEKFKDYEEVYNKKMEQRSQKLYEDLTK